MANHSIAVASGTRSPAVLHTMALMEDLMRGSALLRSEIIAHTTTGIAIMRWGLTRTEIPKRKPTTTKRHALTDEDSFLGMHSKASATGIIQGKRI